MVEFVTFSSFKIEILSVCIIILDFGRELEITCQVFSPQFNSKPASVAW